MQRRMDEMNVMTEMNVRRVIANAIAFLSAISIPVVCCCFYLLVDYYADKHWEIDFFINEMSDFMTNSQIFETGIIGVILTIILILYTKLMKQICEKICFTRFGKRYRVCFWIEVIIAVSGFLLDLVFVIISFTDNAIVAKIRVSNIDYMIGIISIDCAIVSNIFNGIADDMNYGLFSEKNSWVTEIVKYTANENNVYPVIAYVVDNIHLEKTKMLNQVIEEYITFVTPDLIEGPFIFKMGYIAQGTGYQPFIVFPVVRDNDSGNFNVLSPTYPLFQVFMKNYKQFAQMTRQAEFWERHYPDGELKRVHKKVRA